MPSGPPELHAKWESDTSALKYLEKQGYVLGRDGYFGFPDGRHETIPEEAEAICYLIAEWDYGGLRSSRNS